MKCQLCKFARTISSKLCEGCALELVREHNAEDGAADLRAEIKELTGEDPVDIFGHGGFEEVSRYYA